MSTALVKLGFQKPKQRFRVSAKEMCITAIWAAMALLIGMGIVRSLQTASPSGIQSSSIQGL